MSVEIYKTAMLIETADNEILEYTGFAKRDAASMGVDWSLLTRTVYYPETFPQLIIIRWDLI